MLEHSRCFVETTVQEPFANDWHQDAFTSYSARDRRVPTGDGAIERRARFLRSTAGRVIATLGAAAGQFRNDVDRNSQSLKSPTGQFALAASISFFRKSLKVPGNGRRPGRMLGCLPRLG